MLQIDIKPVEMWDEKKEQFIINDIRQTIKMEHSLVSISKWESKWKIPFLGRDKKTPEQILDYIKCMTITQNVKDEVYNNLTVDDISKIEEYIAHPMTATTFNEIHSENNREIVTSELIYYWMIALEIPMECQKWHLNRLLTLIRVCNIKNKPGTKINKRELASKYASINAKRKKQYNTSG